MSHNIKQWDAQFSKSPLHRLQNSIPLQWLR